MLSAALRRTAAPAARTVRCMSGLSMSEDTTMIPTLTHAPQSFGEVQVETLANGVTVVTEDGTTSTSKVTIVVAAGSRNEGIENAGVSNVMKAMAFQSNTQRSALSTERQTASLGAKLNCEAGREVITYSANFLRKDIENVVANLSDATTSQAFKSWEVGDVKKFITTGLPTKAVVVDGLHAGAFRSTLGNSNTVSPYKLGDISPETLAAYTESFFTAGNMTVVGSGVDHAELVELVERNFSHVKTDDTPAVSAEYHGGFESRNSTGNGETAVAVGYEGVAAGSEDQTASLVLEAIVNAAAKGTGECINYNYTDTGLFGVYVEGNGDATSATVSTGVNALKAVVGGGFDDAAVGAAKNQVMMAVLDKSAAERADFYSGQALTTNAPLTPEAFADAVDAVTTADVKAVAKKIAASKPVVSSAGNVAYAPYASELGL